MSRQDTEHPEVNTKIPGFSFSSLVACAGGLLFVCSLAFGMVSYVRAFDAVTEAGPTGEAIASNLLLFSGFALHHSLFARTRMKGWIAARVSPRLERSVYVWISSVLFIVVCAWWQPVSGTAWHVARPWSLGLVALQLAGVGITAVASRQLDVLSLAGIRQALDSRAPAQPGIITRGCYRLVRHPIYFGWVLMVWPAPHMTGTRLVFAAVSTFYLALAVPFEERSLEREFGKEYAAYAARVRWRMVPYLY